MSAVRLQRTDYTAAWICVGEQGYHAAKAMLDRSHEQVQLAEHDDNQYALGSIAGHNVAVLYVRSSEPSIMATSAATARMRCSFSAIKHWLLVDIAQGIPSGTHDIRIGDIVVGEAKGGHNAVKYFDTMFKRQFNEYEALPRPTVELFPRGTMKPIPALADAVARLRTVLMEAHRDISDHLLDVLSSRPLPEKYKSMDSTPCPLYKENVPHQRSGRGCAECGPDGIIPRAFRPAGQVHYGTIGTTPVRIRDAVYRNYMYREHGVICLDMDSAGLAIYLPCLVIKGIKGYADSHSSTYHVPFATAIAATYARELLKTMPAPSNKNVSNMQAFEQERVKEIVRTKDPTAQYHEEGGEANGDETAQGELCLYGDTNEAISSEKAGMANKWCSWFDDVHQRLYGGPDSPEAQRKVKIALLDSGIELSTRQNDTYNPQGDLRYHSWISNESFIHPPRDDVGHGTHLATLMAKLAPDAQIHVARVFETRKPNMDTDPANIAQAVYHAIREWQVDIIVMAFGFDKEQIADDPEKSVFEAIKFADSRGIPIFAAASNDGANRPLHVAWPARSKYAICVHSGTGSGDKSWFTPGPSDNQRIMVLGECVQSAWPEKLGEPGNLKYMSGTSCAAAVAGAIAAIMLDFGQRFLSEVEWRKLRRPDCMHGMLEKMKNERGADYSWVRPWDFFHSDHSQGWMEGEVRDVLGAS